MTSSIRHTNKIDLPQFGIGTQQHVIIHEYVPANGRPFSPDDEMSLEDYACERAYIQASLHCDELPGMLVCHHLLKLFDAAVTVNGILKPIMVAPFANPIGLQQIIMGSHLGRFSMSTGVNFNRDWIDVTKSVKDRIASQLIPRSEDAVESYAIAQRNTAIIRKNLLEEIRNLKFNSVEKVLKKELFLRAAVSSIVLDLHCDTDAILHTYTHDDLWPQMRDLAVHLDSHVNLLSPESGGSPFDEACSCPWASLRSHFKDSFDIEMACQSVTVELRGESDVYDELAMKDAVALYDFFAGRGYVVSRDQIPSDLLRDQPIKSVSEQDPTAYQATPLTAVDMVEGPFTPGILAWRVSPGDYVTEGQVLGEVVAIEAADPANCRVPIVSRVSGTVYGMRRHKLSWPGETIIKVAGKEPLQWRKGNLLTL